VQPHCFPLQENYSQHVGKIKEFCSIGFWVCFGVHVLDFIQLGDRK
jgi:hypothetical protein